MQSAEETEMDVERCVGLMSVDFEEAASSNSEDCVSRSHRSLASPDDDKIRSEFVRVAQLNF